MALSVIRSRIGESNKYVELWQKLIYYYDGHHMANLIGLLEELFPEQKTREEMKLLKGVANLTAFVVNARSQAYNPEPIRTVLDASGEVNEKATASFTNWAEEILYTQQMERAYQLSRLCRVAVVKPVVRKSGLWDIDVFSPDMFYAASDPESGKQAIAFAYEINSSDAKNARRTIIGWTPEGFYRIDDATKIPTKTKDIETYQRVFEKEFRRADNPYGRMPLVWIYENPASPVLIPAPSDILSSAQDTLNIDLTQLNQTKRYQSFAIPVAHGLDGDLPTGPNNYLGFNTKADTGEIPPDFKWVTPGTDFEGVISAITFNVTTILQTNGISPETFFKNQQPSSGYALKIRDADMYKLRAQDIAYIRQIETKAFNLIAEMSQHDSAAKPSLEIPPGSRLRVTFPDASVPEDPLVQNQIDANDLEMGLVSKVTLYRRRNPECQSDAEAAKALADIAKVNAQFPTASGTPNFGFLAPGGA